MATVAPTPVSRPFVPPEASAPFYGAVAIANGDDLDLSSLPGKLREYVEATPGAATTTLNSITDGSYPGQQVVLVNVHATNVLRVPAALGNVLATADVDVIDDIPKTLVWNGVGWLVG